jgi:hypothetical protein
MENQMVQTQVVRGAMSTELLSHAVRVFAVMQKRYGKYPQYACLEQDHAQRLVQFLLQLRHLRLPYEAKTVIFDAQTSLACHRL